MKTFYPKVDEEFSNDRGQIFIVKSILDQAAETQYVKEEVFRACERGTLPEDPRLNVAGEVIQEFLDQHAASGADFMKEGGTHRELTM